MKPTDIASLLGLGALWGASYLFMHVGGSEFGAWALGGLRAGGAALCLLPLLAFGGRWRELLAHWKPIAVAGLASAALPFVLFAFATQGISTGLAATMNAATPIYAAAIGWFWLSDRLTPSRVAGVGVGLAGVAWLVWDRIGLKSDDLSVAWSLAAALGATLAYGFTGNFTKRYLGDVSPLVVTAGGQLASAVVLAGPTFAAWPATAPSVQAWWAMAALALGCTALAYLVYFRLIAAVGASRAVTVSFLIPGFGVLWGALFLGETITAEMALGCGVILIGTALTAGAWDRIRASCRAAAGATVGTGLAH
jgi:drug/metabolite transporter (DMT)-like permease